MSKTKKVLCAVLILVLALTLGALGAFALEGEAEDKGEISIWIIAGQSNAVGYAEDKPEAAAVDARYENGFDNILFFGQGGGTLESTEFAELTLGNGKDKTSHGAEIGIASALGNSGQMHAVIKSAFGGTAIYPKTGARTWTSPSYVEYMNELNSDTDPNNDITFTDGKTGALYTEFKNTMTEALALLAADGYTPVLRGVWWMQGEDETGADHYAVEYERLLTYLINDMRDDLAAIANDNAINSETDPLPFVLGKIYRNPDYDYKNPVSVANVPVVNAAQEAVATTLENVTLVDSHECYGFAQQDTWHYSSEAQMHMGEQFVARILRDEGKYLITSDGPHAIVNGGLYSAGSPVTVSFTEQAGYEIDTVTMKIGDAEPVAIELDADGNYVIASMPEAEVRFNIVATAEGAVDLQIGSYGILPKAYYLESEYPLAIFKDGLFVDVCDNITVDAAKKLAASGDGSVLVIRRDYDMVGEKAGDNYLSMLNGSATVDLLGNTLSMGTGVSADALIKCDAYGIGYHTGITLKNGKILLGEDPIVRFSAATSRIPEGYEASVKENAETAQHFDVKIESIDFGLDPRHTDYKNTLLYAFQDLAEKNRKIIVCSFTVSDCSFDFAANTDAFNLFVTSNIDVTARLVGGSIKAGDISKVTVDATNGGSSLTVDEYEGEYVKLLLPEGAVATNEAFRNANGESLGFAPAEAENGYTVYKLIPYDLSTPYGRISDDLASVDDYPWVLFKNGECLGGYLNYSNDSAAALAAAGDGAVLYLRRDYSMEETSNTNMKDNLSRASGTVTIDLGAHKVTMGKGGSGNSNADCFIKGEACRLDITTNIVLKNGTVALGADPFVRYDTAPSDSGKNNRTNAEYIDGYNENPTRAQKINISLVGVKLTASSATTTVTNLILYTGVASTFTTDLQKNAKSINTMIFKDSVIDLGDTAYTSAKKLFSVGSTLPTTFVFSGGTVKAPTMDNVTMSSVNYVKFEKNDAGEYTSFEFPKDYVFSTTTKFADFTDGEAAHLVISKVAQTDTLEIYKPVSLTCEGYGSVTATYASPFNYPLAVFTAVGEGESRVYTFFGGYADYHDALTAAYGAKHTDVVLFLRGDYEYAATKSWANIGKLRYILFDLNGYTLTDSSTHNYGLVYFSMKQTGDTAVTFRNGNVILASKPFATVYSSTAITAGVTTARLVLDNVNLSYKAGSSATSLIVLDNQISASAAALKVDIDFINTTIDLTNAKAGALLFNADMSTKAPDIDFITSITVSGGKIIAPSESSFVFSKIRDGSEVVFTKSDGKYTELIIEIGAEAPSIEVSLEGGHKGVFTKIASDAQTETYRITPEAVAEQNFVPKMSLTLDRELILNVYIPMHAHLTAAKLDGEALDLEALEVKDGYYVKRIPLAARVAAADFTLACTLESVGTGRFTLSVLKYADKVLSSAASSAEEKTLVRDVLAYIRAAYAYFGTNDAEKTAKINTIIGEGYSNAPKIEGSAAADTIGMKSVTFVLDGTPAMRFYLADGADASKYEFFIDGTRVKTETSADGKYIDIDVYAYALCETVTYTIDGAESGSFHINAYYTYVSGDSYTGADKAELVTLTECFWRYLQSAREYRNSVIGK